MNLLSNIMTYKGERSRAVSPENPTGEKGKACMEASALGPSRKGRGSIKLPMGEETVIADIKGPGIIRHMWMTIRENTEKGSFVMRDVVMRIYWDGSKTPAVEAPIGDFFCNGFGERCDVASLPIVVNPTGGMNSYFEMPFAKRAVITMTNEHPKDITSFFYTINYAEVDALPENCLYFHAYWRRERQTELAKDYVILDDVKGKGYYVGTYLGLTALERYWWGEGEVKFYIDGDEQYPTICGTGMEDYFGGSWSFAKHENGKTIEQTYTTPFLGYPYYSRHYDLVNNLYHNDDCPPMRGFYRWHVMDPVFFDEELKVTVQQIGVGHKGLFERQDDLSSVAYWYQKEPHNVFSKLPEKEKRWPR